MTALQEATHALTYPTTTSFIRGYWHVGCMEKKKYSTEDNVNVMSFFARTQARRKKENLLIKRKFSVFRLKCNSLDRYRLGVSKNRYQ